MTFMPSLPDTGVRPLARQRFDTAIVILTAANAISAVTESAGGAGAGPETLPRCFVVGKCSPKVALFILISSYFRLVEL